MKIDLEVASTPAFLDRAENRARNVIRFTHCLGTALMKTFNIFVMRLIPSCSLLLCCVRRYWCTTLRIFSQHSSDVRNAGKLTQNQCYWRVSCRLVLSSVLYPDAVSRPYSILLQTEKTWEQILWDQKKYAYTLTRKILHRSKEIFLSVESWVLIVECLLHQNQLLLLTSSTPKYVTVVRLSSLHKFIFLLATKCSRGLIERGDYFNNLSLSKGLIIRNSILTDYKVFEEWIIRTVRLDRTIIMMNRFSGKANIEQIGLDIEVICHSSFD